MRQILDRLYLYSGITAAAFIASIAVIVFAQVGLNLADKFYSAISGTALGLTIPSYSEFTGFFLAAASFLALAYTLRCGGHIRVSLVTGLMPPRIQRGFEILTLIVALLLAGYTSFYLLGLVLESIEFGDMTSGMVSVPVWIPQVPVFIGMAILTIALADELVNVLRGNSPTYQGQGENLMGD